MVREVHSKSIVDTCLGTSLVAPHATNELDYTQPNDLLCWHCAAPFDTPPLPIPLSFDQRTRQYVVEGNFCSLACCRGYLFERAPFDAGHRQLLLKQMALVIYDQDLDSVVAAPPHTALKSFGGTLSLDEFRGSRTQVRIDVPPFLPHRRLVHVQSDAYRHNGWSVFNLRRPQTDDAAPQVVQTGERGSYFDYVHAQDTAAQVAAPPSPRRKSRGALEKFMK